jgi:hypothetical protein
VNDLLARFEEVRRADQLDETCGGDAEARLRLNRRRVFQEENTCRAAAVFKSSSCHAIAKTANSMPSQVQ